jgi:hypothetical protein
MKRQFIPDKEKSLSPENDFLKTSVYARTLKKIIDNSPKNEVFTIGLFGNWGAGKSSIIETAKKQYENDKSKVKFITYDAWKYANDSFRRMFLLKVQEELRLEQTPEMERFYQSENAEVKQKQVFTLRGIIVLFLLAIAVAIIVAVLPSTWIDWTVKTPIISIVPLLALLITAINGFFYNLKISVSKPALFAPEQFETCFKQMMETSLKKRNKFVQAYQRVVDFVQKGEASATNLDKVVIVIDNIDRCDNKMAYQLLTDIKTFLGDEKYNVIFIIPVDDDALKAHLSLPNCDEFLRKFFNVNLRIKPHQPTEMLLFADEINKSNSLGFNKDTIALAAKEFATNPRRIIQLFNNLSSELTLYPEDFADQNEALICAILIIREEFPDFYSKVLENMVLLRNGYDNELKDDKKALSFMKIAEVIFRGTTSSDILKVLTNTSSQFDVLPADIRKSIGTNAVALSQYLSRNQEQDTIIQRFILDCLGTDAKYGSISQMANWLDFLSELHSTTPIDGTTLKLLNERHNGHYDKILPFAKNTSEICIYAQALETKGCLQLKESIIRHISVEKKDNKISANAQLFVRSVFQNFNKEKDSKALSSFAERYYKQNPIIKTIDYSDSQKKYLFTDALVLHKINQNIDSENYMGDLLWLFENKTNISNESYGAFFNHIDASLGSMTNNLSKEPILTCVKFLLPFLERIPSHKLNKEPSGICAKIFNPRNLVQRNQYNQNITTSVKLLDEYENDKDAQEVISTFCCEIYRITDNNTNVVEQLAHLYRSNKDFINSKLVSLLQQEYNLHPLFDIILSDNDFSQNSISLTEHCLTTRKKDKTRLIDATALKNKIADLVNNSSNEQVANLIVRIDSVDPEIKAMVVEEIVRKDNAFINSLPPKLLDLAVEAFNKDTSTAYITNYPYLEIVAEKCGANQKSVLINSLLPNIPVNKDIDNTLRVFEKMTIGNQKEKNLVHAQLDSFLETIPKEDKALKERVESLMQKFEKKE